MAVDPDLARLLQESSDRSIEAVTEMRAAFTAEVGSLREQLSEDRIETDKRLARLERRSGALVVETKNPDGEVVKVEAKKSGINVGTVVAIIAALTPIYAVTIEVLGK